MSSVINTNIGSLNAQNNLSKSQNALQTSLQRLSSGLRINSAADDSAGLAISSRMTSQISGLNQAARNANDAISLVQTADGALSSISDSLQRMRDLAVQSSNATNTAADRNSLNTEFQQLSAEINRVANQTSFNGNKLLDGSFGGALFQVGANAGENISVNGIINAQTSSLGGVYTRNTASVAASTLTGYATAVAAGSLTIASATSGAISLGAIAGAGSAAERAGQIADAINQVSQQTGIGASYDAATGQLSLSTTSASITFAGAGAVAANVGWAAGAVTTAATTTTGVVGADVLSYSSAQNSIGMMDTALASINSARGTMGAVQNRFQSAVANLQSTSTNLSSARSRIQDTDFASETANLTRAQILQQAGTAMLAQANSAPNQVLSLLKG